MTGRFQNTGKKLREALRLHGKEVLFYCGVALALTTIAFAAERYRVEQPAEAVQPVLPAIELTTLNEPEEPEAALLTPPEGVILRAYAERPGWNGVLRLWENHTAVDYQLENNTVASLSAGIVRTVGKSGVYGGFVEVESGEYLLRYASIAPREDLAPGDVLKPGDSIGTADMSMPGEAALGAHLHLELFRGETCEDFAAACETA